MNAVVGASAYVIVCVCVCMYEPCVLLLPVRAPGRVRALGMNNTRNADVRLLLYSCRTPSCAEYECSGSKCVAC